MKKLLFVFLFTVVAFSIHAQQISNWSIMPPNPTTNDSVTLIVDSWFPSGTCDLYQWYIAPNGNTIDVSFTHCMGMLTVICNETDSFSLGKLNAGVYNLNMFLYSGALLGPTGCTASLSDAKTTTFSVTQATALNENEALQLQILIDQSRIAFVTIPELAQELKFALSDLTGRLVLEKTIDKNNAQVDLSNLKPGVYIYAATSNDGRLFKGKLNLQ